MFGFHRQGTFISYSAYVGTSSKNLHKIAEKTHACTEEDKYLDNNIFGRYAYNGSNDGRNSHVQRHFNLPPATFGFCSKSGEVHFESGSGNRVPTSYKMGLSLLKKNQLKIQSQYQDVHAKGQVTIHLEKLQTSKIDRSSYLKNSGRFASSGKLLISSQIKALRATQGYSSTAIQRRNFSDGSKISRSSMGVT